MATVVADMTMSLDGFVALPNDDPGPLFDWFSHGPARRIMMRCYDARHADDHLARRRRARRGTSNRSG